MPDGPEGYEGTQTSGFRVAKNRIVWTGDSRMELLEPIGADVVALPCPRALDHTPPGDWTLIVRRNDEGHAIGLDVGCWLARGLRYERIA